MEEKCGKYLIAFLDLLGAAKRLKSHESSCDMIKVAKDMACNAINSKNNPFLQCSVYTFSDNIALCVEISAEHELEDRIKLLAQTVADMICFNAGVPKDESATGVGFMTPLRGAICYGDLYVDKTMNFLIGEALVRAYELESRHAITPRVIIEKGLEKFIPKSPVFTLDEDGYYFVDFLRYKLTEHYRISENVLKIHTKLVSCELLKCVNDINMLERVLSKYIWLAKYYNQFIKQNESDFGKYEISIDEILATRID